MVLLVLALIWAVVLLSWLHSRSEGGFGDSIRSFRRHLHGLQRTGPLTIAAANRGLSTAGLHSSVPALRPRLDQRFAGAGHQVGSVHLGSGNTGNHFAGGGAYSGYATGGEDFGYATGGYATGGYSTGGYSTGGYYSGGRRLPSTAAARRRQSKKRRRDVLFLLVAFVLFTFVLGVIPGLQVVLVFNVIFDLMLAGYVYLLVRMRNLASERSRKVSYLPSSRPIAPGLIPRGTGRYASLGSGSLQGSFDPGAFNALTSADLATGEYSVAGY